jgi:hypothetical protein
VQFPTSKGAHSSLNWQEKSACHAVTTQQQATAVYHINLHVHAAPGNTYLELNNS